MYFKNFTPLPNLLLIPLQQLSKITGFIRDFKFCYIKEYFPTQTPRCNDEYVNIPKEQMIENSLGKFSFIGMT